jgi:obg-like ATPase 1
VDGIFQVVRVFDDADVTHVEGTVDPIRDLDIIGHELRLKDLQLVDAEVARLEKVVRQIDKTKKGDLELTIRVKEWLEAGKDVRDGKWAAAEIPHINTLQLLTAKASFVGSFVLVVCRLPRDDFTKPSSQTKKHVERIVTHLTTLFFLC